MIIETFFSIEGEGPAAGQPTFFIRFFGCNFTCKGFNNTDQEYPVEDPTSIKQAKGKFGCDTRYAWDPAYRKFARPFNMEEIEQEIFKVLAGIKYRKNIVLSLTGGEPTLHQKDILTILDSDVVKAVFSDVLIETNCSVPLKDSFIDYLALTSARRVIWSNSPKLSNSGEPYEKAIRPDVLLQQMRTRSRSYFKFVSNGTEESFEEISKTVKVYEEALSKEYTDVTINRDNIYVMPEGSTVEQQNQIHKQVAELCLIYGYCFCPRIHIYLYNDEVSK